MPEIRLTINTGFHGAEHEKEVWVDDAEWDKMTPQERRNHAQDEIDAYIQEEIGGEWEYVEPEDEEKWPTKADGE